MNEVAVVVFAHKQHPDVLERISLQQCAKQLGELPIYLVGPENGSLHPYLDLLRHSRACEILSLPSVHFAGIEQYNRLLLSEDFYRLFLSFQYILIHQLDAFVFSPNLLQWCSKGYDYIGAPWLDADWPAKVIRKRAPIWIRSRKMRRFLRYDANNRVGNGGLSLRRVRTFLRVARIKTTLGISWDSNEDIFWSYIAKAYLPTFRLPSNDEALSFAFEEMPALAYERNKHELPFGCHAWWRYDLDFWRPHLAQQGYKV